MFSHTNILWIIAFLHTKQPFNTAWASKEEIMHGSEDRLSGVLCGEQAHHTFRSLGEKIQKFWNVCIEGVACLFFCGFFSVFYYFSKSGGVSNSIWEVSEDIVLCTTWLDFQDAHGENTPQGWQTCIKKKKGTKYCLVVLIILFYVVMCFIFFKITFNSENLLKAIQTSWPNSCTYWKPCQII